MRCFSVVGPDKSPPEPKPNTRGRDHSPKIVVLWIEQRWNVGTENRISEATRQADRHRQSQKPNTPGTTRINSPPRSSTSATQPGLLICRPASPKCGTEEPTFALPSKPKLRGQEQAGGDEGAEKRSTGVEQSHGIVVQQGRGRPI